MRSAVIGVFFASEPAKRREFVEASARVTHTLPIAIHGAQLIALAAACSALGTPDSFDRESKDVAPDWDFHTPWPDRGPSGYVLHSVNAVLEVWRQHAYSLPDAIEAAVSLGGDTDSVGAMVGGIVGATHSEVPGAWLSWLGYAQPKTVCDGVMPSYSGLLASHMIQLPIVLAHGFRRMLPPY